MPYYASQIYVEASQRLIDDFQLHPILSAGLFFIQEFSADDEVYIAPKGFPAEGLIVIRELCDASKTQDRSDEARVHQSCGAPVLSWHAFRGRSDVQVITPPFIPTLAFGIVHQNHDANPPPPIEFIRFLKQLNLQKQTRICFYHYYAAYEDALASAEYAWIFGEEDYLYVRHASSPYTTTLYSNNAEPQIIHDGKDDKQPILKTVMNGFKVELASWFDDVYFANLDWSKYKPSMRLVTKIRKLFTSPTTTQ